MEIVKLVKLKEIAMVRSGYLIKSTLKENAFDKIEDNFVYIMPLRAVDEDGYIFESRFIKIPKDMYAFSDSVILQKNDIVLKSRSSVNTAALVSEDFIKDIDSDIIPTAHFFIIRLNSESKEHILPEFLLWFLNHPGTQFEFKENNPNYHLRFLKKGFVENLDFPILSKKNQKEILALDNAFNKRKELLEDLTWENGNYKKYVMNKIYKKIFNKDVK